MPSGFLVGGAGERREQAEIDVHRLERARSGLDGLDVAAGDMAEQRRRAPWSPAAASSDCAARVGRGIEAGDQADAGGFHIALAAGHLAGKAQPRLRAQPQLAVQQLWRVEEGVAMQAAEPGEFGVLEPGNGAEHALLRAVLQLGLEADDVVERAELVVLAQLHDGVGFGCGASAGRDRL